MKVTINHTYEIFLDDESKKIEQWEYDNNVMLAEVLEFKNKGIEATWHDSHTLSISIDDDDYNQGKETWEKIQLHLAHILL